jgi:hypothetical protein
MTTISGINRVIAGTVRDQRQVAASESRASSIETLGASWFRVEGRAPEARRAAAGQATENHVVIGQPGVSQRTRCRTGNPQVSPDSDSGTRLLRHARTPDTANAN